MDKLLIFLAGVNTAYGIQAIVEGRYMFAGLSFMAALFVYTVSLL